MNKKSLSERDICTKFITPALQNAGWDLDDQIREEVSFTSGRIIVRGNMTTRCNSSCEGILLYPTVQSELSDSYQMENHKISFKTINLAQDWQGIHRDLLRLIDN